MTYKEFLKELNNRGLTCEDYLKRRLGNDKAVLKYWEKRNFVPSYAF